MITEYWIFIERFEKWWNDMYCSDVVSTKVTKMSRLERDRVRKPRNCPQLLPLLLCHQSLALEWWVAVVESRHYSIEGFGAWYGKQTIIDSNFQLSIIYAMMATWWWVVSSCYGLFTKSLWKIFPSTSVHTEYTWTPWNTFYNGSDEELKISKASQENRTLVCRRTIAAQSG